MTTDPFLLEDGDEGNENAPSGDNTQDNKNFAELRKAYNKAEKERKVLLAEVESLRTFQAEVKTRVTEDKLNSVFTEVGLNPAHAKLFRALNPEVEVEAITPEAVATFASEYQLVTIAGAPAEKPEPKAEGFKPVAASGGPVGEGILSIEDATKLIREGRYDEAQKLYEAGRVQKAEKDANGAPIVDWLEGVR